MSYKIVLLLLLSVVSCSWFGGDSTPEYTPQALTLIQPKYPNTNIYDPQNLLKPGEKITEVIRLMGNIKKEKNLDVYLYVITRISKDYKSYLEKNIKLFTNDLSYLKLNKDTEKDARSIFIVFSMEDRQSRIRTGNEAIDYLSNSKAKTYLDDVKTHLKAKNYEEAMLELMTAIHDRVMIKYQLLHDLWETIKSIAFYLILIVGILVIAEIFKFKLSETAETKLKKIKKITENGKPRKEVLETVCIICLDELKKEGEESLKKHENKEHVHTNLDNGLNQNPPPSETQIPSLEEIQIEDEKKNLNEINYDRSNQDQQPKKDNNTQEENFIAKLECGHTFHSKCIAEWMIKQNKCPVCREKIDKEEEEHHDEKPHINDNTSTRASTTTASSLLTRHLVNIQTSMHPELSRLDFTYGDGSFLWALFFKLVNKIIYN
jgi:hypothetical protein